MNPLAITFALALASSFAVLVLLLRPAGASKPTRQRLAAIRDSFSPQNTMERSELAILDAKNYAARLGVFLERFRFVARLKVLLIHAGSRMSIGAVVLASAGCGAVAATLCFVLTGLFLPAVLAGAAGSAIPYVVLRIRRSRRVKAFNTALPDAIDLLARALCAGHSIGAAIEMVGEQSPAPLGFEFVQVFQQQRLGLHFRDVMLRMGERMPSRDLHFLITAILIQRETGGDLPDVLDRTAYVIRERIRIEGEVRTRTAQGRLTGWILALLPVIMLALLNMVNPGYSDVLFHDPVGRKLLYTGVILITLGTFIISKIVDVQV